jgi:hypothetical protein
LLRFSRSARRRIPCDRDEIRNDAKTDTLFGLRLTLGRPFPEAVCARILAGTGEGASVAFAFVADSYPTAIESAAFCPPPEWRFAMNERALALTFLAAGLALAGCSDSGGPSSEQSAPPAATAADASGWQHPQTPWGDPDLRGMWPIINLISTPFQRPLNEDGTPKYGDRRFLTDEEYAETQARLAARDERYRQEIQSNKMGMGHWAEASHNNDAARLTSLIVDPPNGRFPELTERGKELASKMSSSWSKTVFDQPTDFDTWDRCITRGLPPSMFPFNYNNGIEIHQAPGYVVVRLEMIHEARIIPVDGRPQLDPAIKQWMGESRGRFEGNTLVVETTNFNGVGGMTNVGIPGSPRGDTPTTTNMKIVERFTRTSDDTIEYSMSVEDPEVLTQPWAAAYPMLRDDSYQFFEYACHEDNTAVRNFIETSRYERAQAAGKSE